MSDTRGTGEGSASSSSRGPAGDARKTLRSPRTTDPTLMRNQPALQTSHGLIWIVMGGLLAAISLTVFGALVFSEAGETDSTRMIALVAGTVILVLYVALVVMRFVFHRRVWRLRAMAVCMIAMAVTAVVGLWLTRILV